MSRTNPCKKKPRSAKRTLLIYGEGLHEEIFLKYLRGIYSQGSGINVTVRNGKGGTVVNIITKAVNEPGAFDCRIVVLDNDKSEWEMSTARSEARTREIVLLENTPCLEATPLTILRSGQNFSTRKSTWCKSEFESIYLDKKKRTELDGYARIFPKTTLDTERANVIELDVLISLMER
jgi:hypothetical protein